MYVIMDKFNKKEIQYISGSLTDTVNQASILRFQTLITQDIEEFVTYIEVFEDSKKVFIGVVVAIDRNMDSEGNFQLSVTCESAINFLRNRSTGVWNAYPPGAKIDSGVFGEIIKDCTVDKMITRMLEHYNYAITEWKKIQKGEITVTGGLNFVADRTNCLDVLLNNIVQQKGGYAKIREENGVFYLDYLKEISIPGEKIELSVNQKDISINNTVQGLYSRVYVFGQDGIDIHSVNDGLYYVEDTTLKDKIGIIDYVLKVDTETDKRALIQKAKEFLNDQRKRKYSVSINVADRSYIELSKKKFEIYQTCRVANGVLGIDEDMKIVEIERDLKQPYLPKLTLENKAIKQTYNSVRQETQLRYTVGKMDRSTSNIEYANANISSIESKISRQKVFSIMGV